MRARCIVSLVVSSNHPAETTLVIARLRFFERSIFSPVEMISIIGRRTFSVFITAPMRSSESSTAVPIGYRIRFFVKAFTISKSKDLPTSLLISS